jgi:hypothetical protein
MKKKSKIESYTILIQIVEPYEGEEEVVIQTPAGRMLLRPGDYIVTDSNGNKWVFTAARIREMAADPSLN